MHGICYAVVPKSEVHAAWDEVLVAFDVKWPESPLIPDWDVPYEQYFDTWIRNYHDCKGYVHSASFRVFTERYTQKYVEERLDGFDKALQRLDDLDVLYPHTAGLREPIRDDLNSRRRVYYYLYWSWYAASGYYGKERHRYYLTLLHAELGDEAFFHGDLPDPTPPSYWRRIE